MASTAGDIDGLRTKAADALGLDRRDTRVHTMISNNPAQAINDQADQLGSCLCA
ncbi:MAG: hypothetical protein ABI706_11440 [Ilumatobacteraceae bacterium]